MKKLILLLIFISFEIIYSQINYPEFMPLRMGSVWVYSCGAFGSGCFCSRRIKVKVTGNTVINGKTYFQSSVNSYNISPFCQGGCGETYQGFLNFSNPLRVDSLTANLLLSTNAGCNYLINELLLDSFKAKLNDSVASRCPISCLSYRCIDTSNFTIFGTNRRSRIYSCGMFESYYTRRYVYGLGLAGVSFGGMSCNGSMTLLGCVIDGIVYGDTSFLVGINKISSEVPETFFLSQNYPNPFNPVTKIKFSLPTPSEGGVHDVKLVVYDVLGREAASLIPPLWGGEEGLSPGTYEVEFDGSNFPSGVYYYRLESNNYNVTKKMVLIK